jgi:hypothetical protein
MKQDFTTETKKIIRKHFETLYSNKLKNLKEMNKFQDTYNLPKLNEEDINSLSRPKMSNVI